MVIKKPATTSKKPTTTTSTKKTGTTSSSGSTTKKPTSGSTNGSSSVVKKPTGSTGSSGSVKKPSSGGSSVSSKSGSKSGAKPGASSGGKSQSQPPSKQDIAKKQQFDGKGLRDKGIETFIKSELSPDYDKYLYPELSNAEMRMLAKGSRLTQDVFMSLKHEGKPPHLSDEKYLHRFARYGWDEEETKQAKMVVHLWTQGHGSKSSPKQSSHVAYRDVFSDQGYRSKIIQSKVLYQQTDTEATPIIDKAVNTIETLQAAAEDYAEIIELRQSNPELAVQQEQEFIVTYQGLTPDDAAWFADEGTVTLDEMIAMVLSAEGGGIALDDELIVLLANRARTYILGAKESADNAELAWTDFQTADALLEAYALNDTNDPRYEVARRIINNIFAHDDSFFGAQDRDYERGVVGARTEAEQITAWLNLTRNPEQVSSGLGDTIVNLAVQVADPAQWDRTNTRLIDGRAIVTQANNILITDDVRLRLNETLTNLGMSEVRYVPVAGGGASIFFNNLQDRLLDQMPSTGTPDLDTVALNLVSNRFWNCETLRESRPHLLVRSGCATCADLDESLRQSNGC